MILDQLNVASYGGVRFACNEVNTTAGPALIKHRFANSNKNNIENQGEEPRVYTLTAKIFGDNYLQDRDRLLEVIEDGTPKTLIHPFYGRIENAVALPVNYTERVSELGKVDIPITFEISDSDGVPSIAIISSVLISQGKDNLLGTLSTDLSSGFNVTPGFLGNFLSAQGKLNQFVDSIVANVDLNTVDNLVSSSYLANLNQFTQGINGFIQDSSTLGSEVSTIINGISGLYSDPVETFAVSSQFFNFGDSDTPIQTTTAGLIERKSNNDLFNNTVKSMALSVAYESAGLTDFRTIAEVNNVARSLENAYQSIKS